MNQIDGIVVGGPPSSSAPVSQERRRGKRPTARAQSETEICILLQKNHKFMLELMQKVNKTYSMFYISLHHLTLNTCKQ